VTAPDPAQRLAEALRAQAALPPPGHRPGPARPGAGGALLRRQIGWALAVALLAGIVLGAVIGLVSLLFPGVLPAVG
jgi:hypothetical protein